MLRLIQTAPCQFDLAPDGAAAGEPAAAAETLVYAILFTDAEAPRRRVADAWDQRGWYKSPQAGTGLWHVRRQPLTEAARREAVAMVSRALARAAPAISGLDVKEVVPASPADGVSSVLVQIAGSLGGYPFLVSVPLYYG
jgi:phage gp46-like protein